MEKPIRFSFWILPSLMAQIAAWRREHGVMTLAEAVRVLLVKGLEGK